MNELPVLPFKITLKHKSLYLQYSFFPMSSELYWSFYLSETIDY